MASFATYEFFVALSSSSSSLSFFSHQRHRLRFARTVLLRPTTDDDEEDIKRTRSVSSDREKDSCLPKKKEPRNGRSQTKIQGIENANEKDVKDVSRPPLASMLMGHYVCVGI